MVDFKKLMSPKQLDELYRETARWQEEVAENELLTNQELADKFEVYLRNSQCYERQIRKGRGDYDSVLWHVLLPLMARRLRMTVEKGLLTEMPCYRCRSKKEWF